MNQEKKRDILGWTIIVMMALAIFGVGLLGGLLYYDSKVSEMLEPLTDPDGYLDSLENCDAKVIYAFEYNGPSDQDYLKFWIDINGTIRYEPLPEGDNICIAGNYKLMGKEIE